MANVLQVQHAFQIVGPLSVQSCKVKSFLPLFEKIRRIRVRDSFSPNDSPNE